MSGPARPLRVLSFALLLALPPLLLHARHLGPGRIPYLRDLSRTHLAMKKVAVEQMRAGRLPRWNPGHGAGSPLLANANFFHLHPVTLLFLVLPYPAAFSLGLAALSVAASAGTGLWLRGRGLSEGAAAAGAAAFALGGLGASTANLYNLHASYCAVPWVLWASDRTARAPTARNTALLALALAVAAAGGEPMAWAWGLGLALLLGGALRARLAHAAAAVVSLALVALQLLPLAAATADALRGRGFTLAEATRYSLAPARLVEIAWPHAMRDPLAPPLGHLSAVLLYSIYAGISVLALALLGVSAPGRRRASITLLGLLVLSLLLALGTSTPLFPLLFRMLPPLHYFRYPEKLLLPFFVALAALAAQGVDRLRALAPRLPPAAIVALVCLDLLVAHQHLVPGAPAAMFLAAPPGAARALAGHRAYFWLDPGPYIPAADSDDLLEFHLAYHRQALPPSGLLYGVGYVFDPDADSLDPLRMLRLARIVHAEGGRPRLLALAGVERVVSPRPLELPGLTALESDPVFTYAVAEPAPFVRLVAASDLRPAADAAGAAAAIAEPGFDPRRSVVYEGTLPADSAAGGTARFERPEPGSIRIDASGDGLLVVNESYDPGWRATVDGKPAALAPANLAFLGVALPSPGRHQVVLRYQPESVEVGAWISAVSLLAIALALGSAQGMRMRTSQVPTPSRSAAETR